MATRDQHRERTGFGQTSRGWGELTDEQRQAWIAAARHVKSKSSPTPNRRRQGRLTGQMLFVKINNARRACGQDLLTEPPERPVFGLNPVGQLVITNRGGRITLKLEVSKQPAADIIVFGSRPCNRGVAKCFKGPRLGTLPAPAGGLSDITELYVKKHGVPPVGKRLFIWTKQQINGWQEFPRETNAVVPAGPARGSQAKGA